MDDDRETGSQARRPSRVERRRPRAGHPRRPRATPPRGRRLRHRPRGRSRRRVRLRRLLQSEDLEREHPEGLQARRGPAFARLVPDPRAGASAGDLVPRRRLPRVPPRRQGRPPARAPEHQAAPGRACGTSSTTSRGTTASRINPASSVRGPRYSAREGKTPAFDDTPGPRPARLDRHRSTSSGSATRRCS